MRNGIDVSSFSEIVHEVKNNEKEGQFYYSCGTRWSREGGVCAYVKPALIGTLRAPRTFVYPVRPTSLFCVGSKTPAAYPIEIAMTALSGCFLVSVVSGLSAQRCTIEQLNLELEGLIPSGISEAPQVTYRLVSSVDATLKDMQEVVRTVEQMSPNHRTFVTGLGMKVSVSRLDDPLYFGSIDESGVPVQKVAGLKTAGQGASNEREEIRLNCRWVYGTQLSAGFSQDEAEARMFPIDQPKQLGGIDWAPNPQEYLLMALSSDIANNLIEDSQVKSELSDLTISARARVDIRGMCGVADVPVHLQDIEINIESSLDLSDLSFDLSQRVDSAVNRSLVCKLIRQPVVFTVEVCDPRAA